MKSRSSGEGRYDEQIVLNKADHQIAYPQARSVLGVFSVENDLVMASKAGK